MPLGTYQQVQFGDLANRLSSRLGDPQQTSLHSPLGWWTPTEIRLYLIEALRAWQAHSAFFSTRVTFPTAPGVLFYELTSLVPQLSYGVTDQNLIQAIAFHLQESATDGTFWSGLQFTAEAVVKAIQQRRDRFKVESGLGLTETSLGYTGGTGGLNGVLELPDETIDIRRVMWKDLNGFYYILWKTDQFSLSAGSPNWFTNPGTPTDYSTVLQQPLALQLAPPPDDIGTVHIITLNSGEDLNPFVAPTVLNVPDDLAWVVKFGALSDLFGQDGIGKDMERAAYCEERWKDGIQLARIYNSVRLGYLDGVPSFLDSIEELDEGAPNWMNQTPGTPGSLYVLGSVMATTPPADAGPHSITLDITPKFPVPFADADWIQLGQEYIDIILDYAEHLANVKVGAEEIKDSYEKYKNFVSQAAVVNDRLRAAAKNFDVLSDRTRLSERMNPRRVSDIGMKELSYDNQ